MPTMVSILQVSANRGSNQNVTTVTFCPGTAQKAERVQHLQHQWTGYRSSAASLRIRARCSSSRVMAAFEASRVRTK